VSSPRAAWSPRWRDHRDAAGALHAGGRAVLAASTAAMLGLRMRNVSLSECAVVRIIKRQGTVALGGREVAGTFRTDRAHGAGA